MKKRKVKNLMHYDATFKLGKLKADNPPEFEKLFEIPDSTNEPDKTANREATIEKKRERTDTKGS
jgi:hypothetical protein